MDRDELVNAHCEDLLDWVSKCADAESGTPLDEVPSDHDERPQPCATYVFERCAVHDQRTVTVLKNLADRTLNRALPLSIRLELVMTTTLKRSGVAAIDSFGACDDYHAILKAQLHSECS